MGSPKELIEEEPSELPQHRVRITKPFYLGTYTVTLEEYQRVMGVNPGAFMAAGDVKDKLGGQDTRRFPAECGWDTAVEFCGKLSARAEEKAAGRTYQLPSEARWEYACRAGSTGRYSFSLGGNAAAKEYDEKALSDYGWFGDNAGGMPHAVGLKRASAWGLYDMHGNAWEWCQDWFGTGNHARSATDDPLGPFNDASHVYRGGCWRDPARSCRSAFRNSAPSNWGGGFRVSLVLADK
jgi:formylglycine-generating enzyme required for sulfatase activity